MDIKSLVSSLLTAENVKTMSKKVGVSEVQVKDVLGSTLPKLLDGIDLDDTAKLAAKLLGSKTAVASAAKKAGISEEKGGDLLSAAVPMITELLGKDSSGLGSLVSGLAGGKKDVDLGDALGKVGKLFK